MNLQYRIDLLSRLGDYILSNGDEWKAVKEKASYENGWFIPSFTDLAGDHNAREYLDKQKLANWTVAYPFPDINPRPRRIGIVMAGNIPMVGFHDLLCVFLSGHSAMIKASSKDEALITHIVNKIMKWNTAAEQYMSIHGMIKNCDAYIATGSNNSSRYFDYYFGKYPSIIRKNRTSVAILSGNESWKELEKLADDVYQYFGLGCRNVTKIFVPKNYDFVPLLNAFKKYDRLVDHHKYKNNYDYNLAIHMLNNQYYMTNGSILLVENKSLFSPIAQLNFEQYSDENELRQELKRSAEIQCIVSKTDIAFGGAQCPDLCSFADGVDTMAFLMGLH